MSIRKKFSIKLMVFAFLAWFLCQPLIDVGRYKPYFEMPDEDFEITYNELNDFLDVWERMIHSSFGENFKSSSLKSKQPYPKELQKWLRLQHWDIKRFFYVEQRIKDLMEYVEVRNQLRDNTKIIKSSQINLNEMKENLKKRLDMNPYSEEELDLIESALYQITEILAGKAVLEK